MEYITWGATVKDIARSLGISANTVMVHKAKVFEKTGSHNIADVTRHFISMVHGIQIARKFTAAFLLAILLTAELLCSGKTGNFIRASRTSISARAARRQESTKTKYL